MQIFTIMGRQYDSNIYVVLGKHPTIIDTGTGLQSGYVLERIQKYIPLEQITQIILTHEHYDHVGGTLDIFRKAKHNGCQIIAHKNGVARLKSGTSSFAELLGGSMPSISVDTSVTGGETIIIGDDTVEVLYTPGHSIGSLCLYNHSKKILISGDTVFAHGDFGRYDLPGGNLEQLISSITTLNSLEVAQLYPGHGPIIERDAKEHISKAFHNVKSMKQSFC